MPGNEHRNTPAVKPGKMEEHTNMPNVSETGEQPKRRAVTAESMAAKQRDISVSEFFAKNRHLLGFDNPRKALLTAVKEAVDNSLDACEEAGIVPQVRVHIEATGPNRYKIALQDNGPGIVKKQIPLIFDKHEDYTKVVSHVSSPELLRSNWLGSPQSYGNSRARVPGSGEFCNWALFHATTFHPKS